MELLPHFGIAEFGQSLRGPSRLLDKALLNRNVKKLSSLLQALGSGPASYPSYGAVRLCLPMRLNMFGTSRNSLAQTSDFALGSSFPEINFFHAAPPEVSPAPYQHKENMAVCPSVGVRQKV